MDFINIGSVSSACAWWRFMYLLRCYWSNSYVVASNTHFCNFSS